MKTARLITFGAVALVFGWGGTEIAYALRGDDEAPERRVGTSFRALERCLVGDADDEGQALVQHLSRLELSAPEATGWPARCSEPLRSLETALGEGDIVEAWVAAGRAPLAAMRRAIEARSGHDIAGQLEHLRASLGHLPHDDVSRVPGPAPTIPVVRLADTAMIWAPVASFHTTAWASGPLRFRHGSVACTVNPGDDAAVLRCAHPPDEVPEGSRVAGIVAGATTDAPSTAIDPRPTHDGITAYEVESGRILASIEKPVIRGAFRDAHRLRLLSTDYETFHLVDVFEGTVEETEVKGLDDPWLAGDEILAVHDRGGVDHLVAVPIREDRSIGNGTDLGALAGKAELRATQLCATDSVRFIAVPQPEVKTVALIAVPGGGAGGGHHRMADVRGERFILSCHDKTLRVVMHGEGDAVEQRCTVDGCQALPIPLPRETIVGVAPHGRDDILVLSDRPFTKVRLGPPASVGEAKVVAYLESRGQSGIERLRLFPRPSGTVALVEGLYRLIPLRFDLTGAVAPVPIEWVELASATKPQPKR